METTTLLLIIFSIVFVLAVTLYFLPKIKKLFTGKGKKKERQEKRFVKETEVLQENSGATKNNQSEELVSLKDFLKIPPEKIMEQGGGGITLSPPEKKDFFDPEALIEDDPFEGDEEIFEREKYWDDDLSRRLYVEDRKPKKSNPYEIYERSKEKSAKEELKNLSPNMKKILLSDLLKNKDN